MPEVGNWSPSIAYSDFQKSGFLPVSMQLAHDTNVPDQYGKSGLKMTASSNNQALCPGPGLEERYELLFFCQIKSLSHKLSLCRWCLFFFLIP